MGQFNGLTDAQWRLVEPFVPFCGVSRPGNQPIHPRKALDTMIWVLITGARWCDVPRGEQWASKSCAHEYLGRWKRDGTFEKILEALQEVGVIAKAIDLERCAIDGFFSPGKGGGENVDHGYKGKGVTTHLLTDGLGNPLRCTSTGASGNERKEVGPLLKKNRKVAKPVDLQRKNTDL